MLIKRNQSQRNIYCIITFMFAITAKPQKWCLGMLRLKERKKDYIQVGIVVTVEKGGNCVLERVGRDFLGFW